MTPLQKLVLAETHWLQNPFIFRRCVRCGLIKAQPSEKPFRVGSKKLFLKKFQDRKFPGRFVLQLLLIICRETPVHACWMKCFKNFFAFKPWAVAPMRVKYATFVSKWESNACELFWEISGSRRKLLSLYGQCTLYSNESLEGFASENFAYLDYTRHSEVCNIKYATLSEIIERNENLEKDWKLLSEKIFRRNNKKCAEINSFGWEEEKTLKSATLVNTGIQ